MAKATETKEAPEPTFEPSITLDEFSAESSKSKLDELPVAFAAVCRCSGMGTSRTRDEWSALYELFKTQPGDIKWTDWVQQGGLGHG